MQECELNMIIVAGISYCRDCKKTYRTTEYGKACPACGGHNTYLVTGRDVMVKDIQAVGERPRVLAGAACPSSPREAVPLRTSRCGV